VIRTVVAYISGYLLLTLVVHHPPAFRSVTNPVLNLLVKSLHKAEMHRALVIPELLAPMIESIYLQFAP
jgi:hypothetical protein